MKPRVAAIVVLLALPGALIAADGFDGMVRNVERGYGAKRLSIPFMGLANALVQLARPAGARGFQLAVFEDLEIPEGDDTRFFALVREGAGPRWQPLVRVQSRSSRELTAIYTRRGGRIMNLLLANYEPGEATLVEVKLDAKTFARWIQHPEYLGRRMLEPDEN